MRRAILILLITLLSIRAFSAESRFSWLNDLKDVTKYPPSLIQRPQGGYIVLWTEDLIEGDGVVRYQTFRYYFRIVDSDGKIILPKKEFEFWNHGDYTGYGFNNEAAVWIDSDKLLLVVWKMVQPLSDPVGWRLERVIISSSGEILAGPDTSNIGMSNCRLVKDSNERVFAVETELTFSGYVRIAEVYPKFGAVKEILPNSLVKQFFLSGDESDIAVISGHALLVIFRLKSYSGEHRDESPRGWVGLPNHFVCALIDFGGQVAAKPYRIDLTADAFRKIPGIHLGGNYGQGFYGSEFMKGAHKDLDLTNQTNGEVILSATGMDNRGDLCVYQVKFSSEGELLKPDSVITIQPHKFPQTSEVAVSKVLTATTGLGEIVQENSRPLIRIRRELVLIGFDESGNFYEEREIWSKTDE